MLLTLNPVNGPITKEMQVGRFGRKAKREKRWLKLRPGIENQLLKDAIGFLEENGIPYVRLLEDWQWQWIVQNTTQDIRDSFSDMYASWADIFVFRKMEGVNWNKFLPVELKSPGRKMRKGQMKKALIVNTSCVKNMEEFKSLVLEFIK